MLAAFDVMVAYQAIILAIGQNTKIFPGLSY